MYQVDLRHRAEREQRGGAQAGGGGASGVEEAREALHNSDSYLPLTVLFASVLFFAGINNELKAAALRVAAPFLGIALFPGTLTVMCFQPVLKLPFSGGWLGLD